MSKSEIQAVMGIVERVWRDRMAIRMLQILFGVSRREAYELLFLERLNDV